MTQKIQLRINQPCHENWEAMTAAEKGKFCGSCQKQVIDFSRMNDREIAAFFKKPATGSVCGRFMTDQLDRAIDIPRKRIPWIKYFFQILLPAFFVSRAAAQNIKMGKVASVPGDTTHHQVVAEPPRLMGMVAPKCIKPQIKDTVRKEIPVTRRVIKGAVTDIEGSPVPSAKLRIANTGESSVTNEKGEFDMSISLNNLYPVLLIAAEGYDDKEMGLDKTGNFINIQLTPRKELSLLGNTTCTYIVGEISVRDPENPVKPDIIDTSFTVSTPIQIPEQDNRDRISVYPNPVAAGNSVSIQIRKPGGGLYNYLFLDLSGKLIRQTELQVEKEKGAVTVAIPPVSAGSYFIVLLNKRTGKKYSGKIEVQ